MVQSPCRPNQSNISRPSDATNSSNNGGNGFCRKKRRWVDPEYIAISDFLSTIGEVDESETHTGDLIGNRIDRVSLTSMSHSDGLMHEKTNTAFHASQLKKVLVNTHEDSDRISDVCLDQDFAFENQLHWSEKAHTEDFRKTQAEDETYDHWPSSTTHTRTSVSDAGEASQNVLSSCSLSRNTRLTELEQYVRELESDNLRLKQTLSLGKSSARMFTVGNDIRNEIDQMLEERTRIVEELVDQLNGPCLSAEVASRIWHPQCRISVGVCEWDAVGRGETISLWDLIRSIFTNVAIDIVDLRPHFSDGEMILTKWRIQGEVASTTQLKALCSSHKCPSLIKIALMSIKSTDLTFTVNVYIIFDQFQIAEQHHCWDQVGVFRRLFGGQLPTSLLNSLNVN
ncbi:unnamed protein product [Albugo candida]|uniref:Uncharacterized protein n=1 Tax=Albugo candida TaxID=65357 RepID=A0A024GPC3_9STRA|nr:unnamed protein product [Albugo candida]|eukprot:CCI48202.1 unnamed protein product [Albugo candida]